MNQRPKLGSEGRGVGVRLWVVIEVAGIDRAGPMRIRSWRGLPTALIEADNRHRAHTLLFRARVAGQPSKLHALIDHMREWRHR